MSELEGDPFHLGVSMFERLVKNDVEFSTLKYQRRKLFFFSPIRIRYRPGGLNMLTIRVGMIPEIRQNLMTICKMPPMISRSGCGKRINGGRS